MNNPYPYNTIIRARLLNSDKIYMALGRVSKTTRDGNLGKLSAQLTIQISFDVGKPNNLMRPATAWISPSQIIKINEFDELDRLGVL